MLTPHAPATRRSGGWGSSPERGRQGFSMGAPAMMLAVALLVCMVSPSGAAQELLYGSLRWEQVRSPVAPLLSHTFCHTFMPVRPSLWQNHALLQCPPPPALHGKSSAWEIGRGRGKEGRGGACREERRCRHVGVRFWIRYNVGSHLCACVHVWCKRWNPKKQEGTGGGFGERRIDGRMEGWMHAILGSGNRPSAEQVWGRIPRE